MPNRRQTSASRLSALKSARRRAKADDVLDLDGLALLWGTGKANFTKIRNTIEAFPPHTAGPNNSMLYPARAALDAMIHEETKDERAAKEIAKRQNAMLGRRVTSRGKSAPVVIPVEQLAKLSRLHAEIEEREREQGLYVPIAEVQRVIGNVFSHISGLLSTLETLVDPSGTMPLAQREMIHRAGSELLLKTHSELRDMLTGNVSSRRRQSSRARNSTGRPRRA